MSNALVEFDQVAIGDLVMFKGQGWVFRPLSFLLSIFDRRWRRLKWKPWHVAVVVDAWRPTEGATIIEGTTPVSRLSLLKNSTTEYRIYRVHEDFTAKESEVADFVAKNVGQPYDVAVFFWTALAYLLKRKGIWFPRIRNKRYTCWELAAKFYAKMHHPICSRRKYPMITDFLEEVGVFKCHARSSKS